MSGGRRRRHLGTLAIAAVALVTAASCSSTNIASQAPASSTTTTTAPAGPTTTIAPLAGCDDTNVTESFQPPATLPTPGEFPAGSYLDTIRQRGRLVVGTAADVLLFSYRNPLTGKIEGFDADMVREVARSIFGDDGNIDDHIEYKIITYAQRIPKLQDGTVDLVAHTMTINCTRWNQISFSSQYYAAHSKLLVSKTDTTTQNLDDMNGKTVCAAKGSTNLEELNKHPGIKAAQVDDLSDCLVLFQQGQVDGILGDDTVLIGFVAQDPYAEIRGGNITDEPYGLGVNKDHPELVEQVNGVLARMRADGTWKDLYTTHLIDSVKRPAGEAVPTPPDPPAAKYGREP